MEKMGYKAARVDGMMVVYGVPIFVECTRGEHEFSDAWIDNAFLSAQAAAADGYFPPLHIRHHGDQDVTPAGFFKIVATRSIIFKGDYRKGLIADLYITNPAIQEDVLSRRLPYRSVEIYDVENPSIDSLALLDHEAPYLELPMLMISELSDESGKKVDANAVFRNPWVSGDMANSSPLIACFRRGRSAHLIFQEDSMAKPAKFAADDPEDKKPDDDKKDDQNMADDTGLDVSALVKAIESGEISVADMDAIIAAIASQKGGGDAAPDDVAPAAVPGGDAMKRNMSAEFAALKGKLDATEARLNQRDQEDQRKSAVSEAMKRLDGRPLGSDIEEKLVAFHRDHGASAFAAYVDSMAQTFGALTSSDVAAAAFAGQQKDVPDEAIKYQSFGTSAVENAAKFSRQWKELFDRGYTRMDEARYVAVNMAKLGHEIKGA